MSEIERKRIARIENRATKHRRQAERAKRTTHSLDHYRDTEQIEIKNNEGGQ